LLKFKEQLAQKEQGAAAAAAAAAAATAQFVPSFGGAFVPSAVPPIPVAPEVNLVTFCVKT